MKETLYLFFDASIEALGAPEVASLLKPNAERHVVIRETSDLTRLLLETLERKGIPNRHFYRREYNAREVRAFDYGTFRIKHRWGEVVSEDFFEEYFDFPGSGCKTCHRGAVQKADFRFARPPKSKYGLFEVDDLMHANVISSELARALRDGGFAGWESRPIRDKQGQAIPGWEQFLVIETLPPASGATRWEPVANPICDACGAETKYTGQLAYDVATLRSATHFALTNEYLGRGLYHPQDIIVTREVIAFFLEHVRFSRLDFQPVRVHG